MPGATAAGADDDGGGVGGDDGVGFPANGVASPLLSATSLNPPPGSQIEGTAMNEELLLSDRNVPRAALHEELTKLYSQGFLTDITLSTEDGKNFEAHRVLLAARSHYFHSVIPRLKTDAVIFLKGVKGAHLDKVLKFIYGSSVSVSKHQLKPILEVAKSLQVKGLQDVSPQELFSRQSVVSAGRFKPDSPLGSPILTNSMGPGSMAPPPMPTRAVTPVVRSSTLAAAAAAAAASTADKTTLTLFKSPTRKAGKSPGRDSRQKSAMQNGSSPTVSDSEEKEKSDAEETSGPQTRRRRGRPPKKSKEKRGAGANGNKQTADPYEFADESNDGQGNEEQQTNGDDAPSKRSWRRKKAAAEDVDEDDAEEDGDGGGRKERNVRYTLHGKHVIDVKYNSQLAELHISRFAGGSRGGSIRYKDKWLTPEEFYLECGGGRKGKKNCLSQITTDYGPLKSLTASGMIKARRRRDDASPKGTPEKRRRRGGRNDDEEEEEAEGEEEENEDVDEEEEQQEEEDGEGEDEEGEDDEDEDDDDEEEEDGHAKHADGATSPGLDGYFGTKRRKRKHRDDWKQQILKTEMQQAASVDMAMGQQYEHPPKISPPATIFTTAEHHHTPTFYVMSPHPYNTAPPTPHHNPFAAAMSPAPTMQMQMPVVTSAGGMQAQQFKASAGTSGSRLGNSNVLSVRCKSTTALLYANRYESGSKGKCIQLGDEWLTPNEFEDRAGSKAKKYLSSIKCLGRPLRVYVNSGELRGTGPPPTPKPAKFSKSPKLGGMGGQGGHQQAIAPAPVTMMQAPPTPSHVSSAPGIPASLNMMMGGQPPILINQTSMGSSMLGNQIIPGLFTIGPTLEVRQNVSQAVMQDS